MKKIKKSLKHKSASKLQEKLQPVCYYDFLGIDEIDSIDIFVKSNEHGSLSTYSFLDVRNNFVHKATMIRHAKTELELSEHEFVCMSEILQESFKQSKMEVKPV